MGRNTISIPQKDAKLAEFVGILLGDGNIYVSKKARVHQIKVTCNSVTDKEYVVTFVKPLVERLFSINTHINFEKNRKGINLRVASMDLVKFLLAIGLVVGDKIKNKATIPTWIQDDEKLLVACIRGLFDTDGTVFHPAGKPKRWIIGFKNYNKKLIETVRRSLLRLGLHPTNITGNAIFICRKNEIELFIRRIGFSNPKHLNKVLAPLDLVS